MGFVRSISSISSATEHDTAEDGEGDDGVCSRPFVCVVHSKKDTYGGRIVVFSVVINYQHLVSI